MVGIGSYEEDHHDEVQDVAGAEIAVTWGEETYSPVQYQSFRVGAFTLRGRVLPGETYEGAHARLLNAARACAAEQFRVQLADHLDRVRVAASAAKGGR
jgi:uncharacterized protein (DUF2336 family)